MCRQSNYFGNFCSQFLVLYHCPALSLFPFQYEYFILSHGRNCKKALWLTNQKKKTKIPSSTSTMLYDCTSMYCTSIAMVVAKCFLNGCFANLWVSRLCKIATARNGWLCSDHVDHASARRVHSIHLRHYLCAGGQMCEKWKNVSVLNWHRKKRVYYTCHTDTRHYAFQLHNDYSSLFIWIFFRFLL